MPRGTPGPVKAPRAPPEIPVAAPPRDPHRARHDPDPPPQGRATYQVAPETLRAGNCPLRAVSEHRNGSSQNQRPAGPFRDSAILCLTIPGYDRPPRDRRRTPTTIAPSPASHAAPVAPSVSVTAHPRHPFFAPVAAPSPAVAPAGPGAQRVKPIYGMSCRTYDARSAFVCGASPSFAAAFGGGRSNALPPGLPPHTPRRGSLQSIGPVHAWRTA
ncbi:hypothetical protein BH11MYX4_BH11MYX4_02740 [soil metagenome]